MTIRPSTTPKSIFEFTTFRATISPALPGAILALATICLALVIRWNKELLRLPGSIFTLLAVIVLVLLTPPLLRAIRLLIAYRLEMDDTGIRIFQGEKTVFRETWQSIPQFVLGYNGHIVSLELYGARPFKVWTGGLTSSKDEAVLKAIVDEIKQRAQLKDENGRRPTYMLDGGILRYPNPRYVRS